MNKLVTTGLLSIFLLLTACGGGGGGGGGGDASDSSDTSGGADGSDNAQEVPQQLSSIELSNLNIDVDISQPLLLNHRIPFSYEIVGRSDSGDVTEDIGVGFYFEETDPIDPDAPRGCDVNATGLSIVGNGEAELVDEFFLWPVSECIELAEEQAEVSLKVRAFRGEERIPEEEFKVLVSLPDLRLTLGDPDVAYELETDSSVAILPVENEQIPAISAKSIFVLNGQDPYYVFVNTEDIPEELKEDETSGEASTIEEDLDYGFDKSEVEQFTRLPSKLTLTYSIAPASVPSDKFPLNFALEDEDLTIEDLAGATEISKVSELEIEEINLGVEDMFIHDLFIEGDAQTAIGFGGIYENENLFVVEGCISMAFAQESNGDASGQENDCFSVEILLERELDVVTTDQPELDFDEDMIRNPGNSRIGLESKFSIVNKLTAGGLAGGVDGSVSVKGKIGKSFKQELAGVLVEAGLSNDNDNNDNKSPSSIKIELRAVGQIVFSVFDENSDPDEDQFENSSPRFDKNQLIGSLGFGVGPINFGFQANVGGRVENSVDLAIESNRDNPGGVCEDNFDDIVVVMDGCGAIVSSVAPEFSLQAVFFGGLNVRVIRVGVEAELNLMNISFPLESRLNVGQASNGDILVRADIGWGTQFVLIKGNVKLVASIRLVFRRRGFTVTLVSFSSRPVNLDLLEVSTGTLRLAN